MARTPKPWFWKARKGWFVTIDGTRHFLGNEKDAAETRFHELMAEPRKRMVRSDSLAVIIDLFLDWCEKHRPRLSGNRTAVTFRQRGVFGHRVALEALTTANHGGQP